MSITFPLIRSGVRHFADKSEKTDDKDGGDTQVADDNMNKSLIGDTNTHEDSAVRRISDVCSSTDIGLLNDVTDADKKSFDLVDNDNAGSECHKKPTVWEEIGIVLSYPCFIYITFGYGALTGVLIGMATFGSSFFQALDLFDSEVAASTAFGVIVSLAGIFGFPLGGYIVDKLVKKHKKKCVLIDGTTIFADLIMSSLIMSVASGVALGLFCLLYFLREHILFFAVISLASTSLFVCNAATSVGLIYSIPVANRPFGIAFNAIVMHLLGMLQMH